MTAAASFHAFLNLLRAVQRQLMLECSSPDVNVSSRRQQKRRKRSRRRSRSRSRSRRRRRLQDLPLSARLKSQEKRKRELMAEEHFTADKTIGSSSERESTTIIILALQ